MAADANLYALFEARFRANAAAAAFVTTDGATTSYAALAERTAQMANALEALGVQPGDRVMVQVEKSLDNVALYLATLKAGAVYNPLNTAYTAAELEYFMGDAEPALVVVPTAKRAKVETLAGARGAVAVATMDDDGTGTLSTLADGQPRTHRTVPRTADDLAALLYTSGTTGRSKGAMITHENLSSNALVLLDTWRFVPGDVLLHALPIFHVHGLFVALNTAFLNGSKILWLTKFDLEAVLRLLPQSTVMMGVPTFYTRLLGADAFGRAHTSNMRLFISGSAPLLAETHTAFEERTGHKILERYGMTEAGMITSNPYEGGRIAGSVGYALPGVSVRIANPLDAAVLPAGEVGVLEVEGPNIFKGYWRNPEKTREDFRADGYFVTGDLSVMDQDGRITIVGRAKDLIISGGFNVYPKEIEEELNALEGVEESAVVGVPHPDFGEAVVAVLTRKTGASLPEEKDIIARLGERLARFKLPKRVFIAEALPRNAMGKVQKADLRARHMDLFKG